MVRGLCPTPAPNPPRQSSNGRGVEDAAPYGGCETNVAAYNAAGAIPSRLTNGARAVPAELHTWGNGRNRAHRLRRGQNRSRRPSAPTLPRRSRNRGAPRTVRPTDDSETNVAAWNVTGARNNTQTARPPHGSAETYPLAATVGGGVPDAPSAGWRTTSVCCLSLQFAS